MNQALKFYNKQKDMEGITINTTKDIADLLKNVREEAGLTVATVSEHIKIRGEHLHFIENDNFFKLPGKVYAVGFVRTYANYLGLNENLIIEKMRSLPEFSDALVIIKSPKIEKVSKGVSLPIIVSAVFLFILFFTMLSFFSSSHSTQATHSKSITAANSLVQNDLVSDQQSSQQERKALSFQ